MARNLHWPGGRRELEEQLRAASLDRDDARGLAGQASRELETVRREAAMARQRLDLARQALLDDGYFPAGEVSDDVAPRITERLSAARQELEAAQRPREPEYTPEEATEMLRMFRAQTCRHCGGAHARACPRVRRLTFHPDAKLATVEFWPDGKWSDEFVQWPENLPLAPEEETPQP
jgi:hypothetical protein